MPNWLLILACLAAAVSVGWSFVGLVFGIHVPLVVQVIDLAAVIWFCGMLVVIAVRSH